MCFLFHYITRYIYIDQLKKWKQRFQVSELLIQHAYSGWFVFVYVVIMHPMCLNLCLPFNQLIMSFINCLTTWFHGTDPLSCSLLFNEMVHSPTNQSYFFPNISWWTSNLQGHPTPTTGPYIQARFNNIYTTSKKLLVL